MKSNRSRNLFVGIVLVIVVFASFFAGGHIKEKEHNHARMERCRTLIVFAIDKAENGDLTDQGTMKAMISNVYAAYQFCENPHSANQLHDLWNYLIFESDDNVDAVKEIVLRELHAVLRSMKVTD